jgi:phage shock protein A
MIAEPIASTADTATQLDQLPALFVLGTPDPTWEPLAQAIWSAIGQQRTGGVVTAGWAEIKKGQMPGATDKPAQFVLLVDSPVEAIASAVASGTSLETALGRWREGSEQALREAQRRPGHCLFLYVPEAWTAPKRLHGVLTQFNAGRSVPAPEWPTRPDCDSVLVALVKEAVNADTAVQRVFTELHASCVILSDASEPRQADIGELSAAIEQYRALRAGRKEDAKRIESLDLAVSRHAQELEQAAGQHAQSLEQVQDRLDASEQEVELLQLQLHQAQDELDAAYERLSRAPSSAMPDTTVDAHAESMRMLDSSEASPHRHLHVGLQNLRIGSRRWPSLELRLLEHHGRPGIALFATGGSPEVVSAWRTSGQENGRDYMLIVPTDDAGRWLLEGLGTSDWRTVSGCASVLVRHLRRTEGDLAERWSIVASRLQAQIDLMAPRFRYDEVNAQPEPPDLGCLSIRFAEASFGTRSLGAVSLRWRPASSDLRWLAHEGDANVPLASWPADEEGLLRRELLLPVGRLVPAGAKREWWSRMPASDRELMLGVLDALPAAAQHLREIQPTDDGAQATTLRAAVALQRDARRILLGLRLRGAARRLLRGGTTTSS